MKRTKQQIEIEIIGTVNALIAEFLGSQFEGKLRKRLKEYKEYSDDVPHVSLGNVIEGSYESWFDIQLIWPNDDTARVEIEVKPKVKKIDKY